MPRYFTPGEGAVNVPPPTCSAGFGATGTSPHQYHGETPIASLRANSASSPMARADRSLMNVPFKLKDESLDAAFLKGAEERRMLQLKGHRSVGGMRASIYNAMTLEGVTALVAYMKEFEARHG